MKNKQSLSITCIAVIAALSSGCASVTNTQPGILTNLIDEANNRGTSALSSDELLPPPSYLQPYIKENARSGLRDQVLVNMKAGVTAMKYGDHKITRRLMEDAYNRIETIYADNKAAKAARSNYVEEANKDFKGEPYERAMVGYYLGLSDMLSDDLQSAKSSFSWGEYQDTLAASEEYQGDMNSLVFLRGWAKQCAGESYDAKDDFRQAGFQAPSDANLLVLVESGKAPVKYAAGEHSEVLKFKAADGDYASSINVQIADKSYTPKKVEDLVFQATTRGGRHFDAVLEGKANFKETTDDVADAAATGAIISAVASQAGLLSGDMDFAQGAGIASVGLGMISLFSSAMSENTVAEADTRQWNNLPRYIHVMPLSIDGLGGLDEESSEVVIKSNSGTTKVTPVKTGNCYLAWQRI